jgi:hypothetical protein
VGGVWYGMSGSPVYVRDGGQDKLIGAVAWGFSWSSSPIIGLTPADDMKAVLDYGRTSTAASPTKVPLTKSMKRTIARATSTTMSAVPDSLVQLRVPVSVSAGTHSKRSLKRLQRQLNRRGMSVRVVRGATAAASGSATAADMVPGSNFAAAISYGDLTAAGIGTTTFQCDGFAMAFGHPFFFEGKIEMGANAASAITVVPDPIFGSWKLATIGGAVGTVDQDRLAGIRADFTQTVTTTPIASSTIAENTGRTIDGQTDVVVNDYVSWLAPYHEELQVISAMDQYSGGSSEVTWTMTGTKSDGTPWKLRRSNMATSKWGIPWETTHEAYHMFDTLFYQDFEEVKFTGVDWDVTVRDEIRQYKVGAVSISENGGRFLKTQSLSVRPGARLEIKVKLNPYDETLSAKTVKLSVRVPNDASRDGSLQIIGGCGCHTGIVRGKSRSFDHLLSKLKALPTNNRLGAELAFGRRVTSEDAALLDQVVKGRKYIELNVRG